MISWEDALDAFEAGLGHHGQLIDTETTGDANPWPPATLPEGPVPEDLRDRALQLLDQSNLLIDRAAEKMAGLPALRSSRHLHGATPDQPRWTATL